MKPRTLVIGDIHGGLKALTQVLERATISEHDTLIFPGDYGRVYIPTKKAEINKLSPIKFTQVNHSHFLFFSESYICSQKQSSLFQ